MKMQLLRTLSGAGWLLAAALSAPASPLQRADLPAEPTWVVHVDVDGLRPTAVGRFLQAEVEKPAAQARLAAFQAIFSFDLRTQLHGLTLYSTGPTPTEGVLLVYADVDPAKLLTLAKAAPGYKAIPYRQHTIHSWFDEKKRNKEGEHPRVYAALQGKRLLFGQRAANISKALDVLDGAVPTLASSGVFAELGAAGDSNFIEGAARKLEFDSAGPNVAFFRLSKQGRFQLHEAQGQVQARLSLEANDPDVAGHMLSIGQGLLGLLKLQQDKPGTLKLANALDLKQDGPRIIATLSLPATELVELLQAEAARKIAKRAHAKPDAEDNNGH